MTTTCSTTCSKCAGLYEAGSEEQANEIGRLCFACHLKAKGETVEFRLEKDEDDRLVVGAIMEDEDLRKSGKLPW